MNLLSYKFQLPSFNTMFSHWVSGITIISCEYSSILLLIKVPDQLLSDINLRGPLSKIHPSVFGRKNKFSSYFVYELDFGQY